MDLLKGFNVCFGNTVVGGGDTNVCFLIAQLKLVVAVLQRLTGDLNALDGNQHGLLSNQSLGLQVGGVGVDLGVIHGGYGLDGGIHNLNRGTYYLVQATVGVLQTGNRNGHTNLQTQISLGILGVGKAVNVVSALVVQILNVHTVAAGAVGLGEDTGNDTLNNHGSVIGGSRVVGIGEYLVGGNGALEGLLYGLAVLCLDGGGENVVDLLVGLFIHVNGDEAGLGAFLNGNALGDVYGPLYGVNHAVHHNAAGNIIIGGGKGGIVLIKIEEIVAGIDQIVAAVGGAIRALRGRIGTVGAACQEGKAKHGQNEN